MNYLKGPINQIRGYTMIVFVLMNLKFSFVMAVLNNNNTTNNNVLTIKFIRQIIQVNNKIMIHIFTDVITALLHDN